MIQEGNYAIFKKDDLLKIFQIKPNKQVMVDRFKCSFDNLINQPWGLEYEIIDKNFQRKKGEENGTSSAITTSLDENKDNRNLLDASLNQKLTRDEIEEMKEDLIGEEIIEKLVLNSGTFQTKTEYSQEKYLKKKKKKYLAVFEVIKPSIRSLCNFYTQGNTKRKILNMRIDTIAQMLTYSNVAANRNVLILESCKGLLLAAVAERLGGYGTIINLSPNGGDNSTKLSLEHMNFKEDITKSIINFPLEQIDKIDSYIEYIKSRVEIANNDNYKERQLKKLQETELIFDLIKNKKIDCLIIATRYRLMPIVEKLFEFMGLNRWFVFYSTIQEPLIECHQYLKQSQKALNIELSDSWYREYQVLPDRTHPKNMMDSCSGFLLTGITCEK